MRAGCTGPRLLVHYESHGIEVIERPVRLGRSLRDQVIALDVDALSGFDHAEMSAVAVTQIEQAEPDASTAALAQHFVDNYGAPSIEDATHAARDEPMHMA